MVSHFVHKDYNIRIILLVFCCIKRLHSGPNLAPTVLQVIDKYNLRMLVGYFVLDNAESNNTCVKAILQKLDHFLQKTHQRLRCIGHIINSAAQALLLDDDHCVFEADFYYAQTLDNQQNEPAAWHKKNH